MGRSRRALRWPQSNHGLTVDHMDNIRIGGNGENDSPLLKFGRDGTFLLQAGMPGPSTDSRDVENFGSVAKISIDPEANEAYAAGGYRNKRVAVIDMNTGELKRYWGAYGNPPDDTDLGPYDPSAPRAEQFRNPVHCGAVARRLRVRVRPRQRTASRRIRPATSIRPRPAKASACRSSSTAGSRRYRPRIRGRCGPGR